MGGRGLLWFCKICFCIQYSIWSEFLEVTHKQEHLGFQANGWKDVDFRKP